MSYSDILRVKNLGNLLRLKMNPLYKPISQPIVTDGLVLYLDGKDFTNSPPTTTWVDKSGLGNNATPSGMAYTTASGSDGAGGVMFDGVDDTATLGISTVGDSASFTIELKFVMTANAMRTLVSKANGLATNARLLIDVYPADTIRFFGYNTLDATTGDTVGVNVTAGTLAYGTFIFDGTNFKTYIDGILKQTTAGAGTLKAIANNFNIGHRFNSAFYNDSIKSVKVYNRVLTNLEIVQNYNASR